MSFTARLTSFIGQAPAHADTFLTHSARVHFRLISPQDAQRLAVEQTVDAVSGLAVGVNDVIVGVHGASRRAVQASPSDIPALSDSTSMFFATPLDPKYYFKDSTLYVLPASADSRAYVLSLGTVAGADNVITWLPTELEEATILRAAILELGLLATSGIEAIDFSFEAFITAHKPVTPTIADAAAGTITAPTTNKITAASLPTLGAFPTASASATIGTLISDIVAGRADMDAIVARIKLATGDVDTPTPASGNDAYSDVTLTYSISPDGLVTSTTGTEPSLLTGTNVPAIIEEALTDFDGIISSISTRLSNEDDVEVSTALVQQARAVLEKYQSQVRENVESHRLKLDEFRLELERAVQQITLGLRDRELDITDKNATVAGISAETERKALELRAEETKVTRNQIRSQDRQAEIQGIATNIRSANDTIQSLIAQYQSDVQKATAEFQGTLREYDAGLQVALTKFQADMQAEMQDASSALQAEVSNVGNDLQAQIQNIQKALAIFSTEAGLYVQAVGLFNQSKNNELQQAAQASQTYMSRMQALNQLYQQTLDFYISTQYAQAPTESNQLQQRD